MNARDRLHDAAEKLGDNWEADVTKVRQWASHHGQPAQTDPTTQENNMTETATHAPADAPVVPFWSAVHQNLDTFASRLETFLPKLRDIATAPWLDELIEAGLLASGQGVAEEVFAGIVTLLKARPQDMEGAAFDLLRAVMHHAEPAGPVPARPSFTPAAAADGEQVAAAPRTVVV
jgi:hypothetical protein